MLYSEAIRRLEQLRRETIRVRGERLRRSALKGESRARVYPVPNYRKGSGVRQTFPSAAFQHPFHFKHSSVSRGGSNTAKSIYGETTAARHQDYIDRPSAQERDPETGLPLSFGTIGDGRTSRRTFWREVEQVERANGRVQCRLIFNLPGELDGAGRQALVRDFCDEAFAARNLPYWVAFHVPAGSDQEKAEDNHHCHAVYYERQARQLGSGEWDFAVTEIYRKKSGHKRTRRPLKQNKHPDTNDRSWIGKLRHLFAAVANHHLRLHGHEAKYDARSYKARGLNKKPSRHLSLHTMAVEKRGVDTMGGLANSQIEIRHRTIQITDLSEARRTRLSAYRRQVATAPHGSDIDRLTQRAGLVLLDELEAIGEELDDNRRKHVATGVGEETVSGQVSRRRAWLDSEVEKSFFSRAKRYRIPGYVELVRDEIDLIDAALIDLDPFLYEVRRNKAFHGQKVEELEKTFLEKEDVLFVLRPELAPAEKRAVTGDQPPSRERREYLTQSILQPSPYEQLVAARTQDPPVSQREASAVQAGDRSDTPSSPRPTHTVSVDPTRVGPAPRVDRSTDPLLLPPNMDEQVFARELEDVLSADTAELEARVATTCKASREARSPGEMRDAMAGLELLRLALTTHDDEDDEVERRFGPRGLRVLTRSGLSEHIEILTTERFGPPKSHSPIDPCRPRPQGNRIIIDRMEDRALGDGPVQKVSDERSRPPRTIDGPVRKGPVR